MLCGSTLAPVIQFVTDLMYKLMKAVQSVAYAFSGVNIFENATVLNGDGSSVTITPSIDLSQVDTEMNSLTQKLQEFFKPLVDSWNSYGGILIEQIKIIANQIGDLMSSGWKSFEKIITNGTVYSILQNILKIIGNISEAFTNAWNYNGNGDAIIQGLANAFDNLLVAINNVVQSDAFQSFLNFCSDKFKEISEKLADIDWQPLIDALMQIGSSIGTVALDILSGLTDIFKWLVENPIIAEILISIAVAIGIVSTALTIITTIIGLFTLAMDLFNLSLLPTIAVIVAIVAVIILIILAVMNWDSVMSFLKQTVETVINAIGEFFTNLWIKISSIFEAIWQVISTILNFIWNMIKTVFEGIWNIVSSIINAIWQVISTIFQSIWNIISTILSSIWNIFSQIFNWIWQLISKVFEGIWNIISPIINKIWETIKFVLGKIQEIWSNIWNTISSIVKDVWNGIWSCIKGVINLILGGIENFVNGAIKGINFLLRGISKVANAIGSLIGLSPINLQLNTVSLPRLARGGIIYSPTLALVGEYSGARNNPEIITPQNIMAETFRNEMLNMLPNAKANTPIRVQMYWGTKNVLDEIIDGINEKTRQTGKAQIKVAYDY